MNSSISITSKFSLPKEASFTSDQSSANPVTDESGSNFIIAKFDASNCEEARFGLPENVTATKLEAGDYTYSGMHDQGPLYPKPKESGPYALLLSCTKQANAHSDTLLTEIIENQKKNKKKR